MEFGIFVQGHVPGAKAHDTEAEHAALLQEMELVKAADKHNWKYAWFGEQVRVPVWLLVAMMLVPAAIIISSRLLRGEALLAEVAPPAEDGDSRHPEPEMRSSPCN